MKVLFVHNYLRPPSGENVVFENERTLLRQYGHEVITYERRNEEINSYSSLNKISLSWNCLWSREACSQISGLIDRHKPDVAHFHNTFPLMSPAVYRICIKKKVPVLQTLHHFRMICPGALLFRDQKICEDCVKGSLWNGVFHGCYNKSRSLTGVVALMNYVHRILGTYRKVTYYIALNEFCRSIFVNAGIPAEQILVKPNFLFDTIAPSFDHEGYAIYLGRVSHEKGIRTMLKGWVLLKRSIPLKIVGEGYDLDAMIGMAKDLRLDNVEFLGYRPPQECAGLTQKARFMIVPTECYETFSLVVREAFAAGKPVLASRLGVLVEAVVDHKTGLTFEPGNSEDFATKAQWLIDNDDKTREIGVHARKEYEMKYTPERNYQILMEIYKQAVRNMETGRR